MQLTTGASEIAELASLISYLKPEEVAEVNEILAAKQADFFKAFYEQKAALFDLLAHHLFSQFILINPETKKPGEPLHDAKQVQLPKSWHDDIQSFMKEFNYRNFYFNTAPLRPDYTDSAWLLKIVHVCFFHAEVCRNLAEHSNFELVMKIDEVSNRLLGIAHSLVAYLAALGDEKDDLFIMSSSLSH